MEKELQSLLLQDFPESFLTVIAIFALLKLRFNYKKILIISALQTFTNLIRLLPIAFGMHTIILLISITVYTRIFTQVKILKILTVTVFLAAIMAAMQAIYVQPLLKITNLTFQEVSSSPILRAAFCLPYEFVFFALAIISYQKNKKQNKFIDN